MTRLAFDAPPTPVVPIAGADLAFPVARIFCVGRNYAEHAREMGAVADREAPFIFTKPASAVVRSGATVPYPPGTDNLHHEVELVAALGAPAFRLRPEEALAAVYGYACGLDLTRRDLQQAARDKGRPWDLGKAFENSAPVGAIVKAGDCGPIGAQRISLTVNGEIRQDQRLSDMIFPVAELVSWLSRYYHLGPGDLLFTGTPSGVGPVRPGDRLVGRIEGLPPVEIAVGAAE